MGRALRARTKSSPTASNTFGLRRFAPEQRARKPSAFGRMETRLRRAITQALRARLKSSPTASTTFGLRRFAPDYGRFAPEQRAPLRRMETRLRRAITQALRA